MVVKKREKKDVSPKPHDGILELSPELQIIREMITHLPPEGEDMEESTSSKPVATKKAVKKVAPKKVAKKVAAAPKKVVVPAKATPAKEVAKSSAAEGTTLSTICETIKVEPRWARRVLRTAEIKNPGRWAWTAAADVAKIKKLLAEATK